MATKVPGRMILMEAVESIRAAARESGGEEYRERLNSLADELEGISNHAYLQTRRGRKEVARLTEESKTLQASLEACSEDEPAYLYCESFSKRIEVIIEHARALESR